MDGNNKTQICLKNLHFHPAIIQTVVYSILLAVSVLGNLLVIIVVSRSTEIKATVNYFILNMAVSDLLYTIIAIPRDISQVLSNTNLRWHLSGLLGTITCKLCFFAQDVCTVASILTMVAIAFDRYYAIVYPMRAGVITPTIRKVLVALIWMTAMAFHTPYFLSFRLSMHPIFQETICIYEWVYSLSNGRAYFLISSFLLFFFPLLIMTVIYTFILISIKRSKIPGNANSSSLRRHRIKRNRKVLTMVIAVLAAFIICWLPMNLYGFLKFFGWYTSTPCSQPLEQIILTSIVYSNAAINPFIYFALSENYRRAAINLLKCRKRRLSRPRENTFSRTPSSATHLMPRKRALKENTELIEMSKRHESRIDSVRHCLVEKSLNSSIG